MGYRMRRMLLLATVALAGLTTGCRTISRGITESVLERETAEEWQVRYGSRVMYTLTNETLTDVEFEGSVLAGDVVARYQRGLGPQAQCIADRTAELLERVSERTSIDITTRTTVYLIRFDQRPQNYNITLAVEPNEFPLPLFVRAGEESCEAILAQNRSYPYLAVHELVETSLVNPAGGQVLPDLSWRALGLDVHVNNYTRWFRDGLANYAGYIAYGIVSGAMTSEQRLSHRQALLHEHPFTALAEIGDRLFSWPQSSATERERTYYNAALGLFLLIVDEHGERAIRDIMAEIDRRETVDGRDLVAIVNDVIGTDVKRLAAEFEFPVLGIELERMTPALALNRGVDLREGLFVQGVKKGSPAAAAGLQEKDVIAAVDSRPVINPLDLELALFKVRKQQTASLTVARQGAGTMTLNVRLEKRDDAENTHTGNRRNPREKGQVELTRS